MKATTGFKIALRARFWCVRWRGRGVGVIVVFWVGMGVECGGVEGFVWLGDIAVQTITHAARSERPRLLSRIGGR